MQMLPRTLQKALNFQDLRRRDLERGSAPPLLDSPVSKLSELGLSFHVLGIPFRSACLLWVAVLVYLWAPGQSFCNALQRDERH